jgi:thiazole synthase ThiGH ThiG subunit
MEYVLIQRARLGRQIDGGRHKMGTYTHPDAEVIAATVAGMPDDLGGMRMAIRVAELARARLTPNWMPGAVPRCVPVDTKRNRYGDRAVSVVVGTGQAIISGRWRSVEVRACPVTFRPDPHQIAAARRDYDTWWHALGWVRDGLVGCRTLREIKVTSVMPKVRPWEARVS